MIVGADGVNDGDVATGNPMPVGDAGGSLTVDNAGLTELAAAINSDRLDVNLAAAAASVAVTNAGTFAVQATVAAAATSIAKAEDAAHASGDVGVPALAVRTDTAANRSGADGDYEPLQISAGRLWTSATIDAALPAGSAAIGKLAANSGVDIGDVDILSIAAGDNNIGNVDIASIAAGDNNIGNVDVVTSALPTGAATLAEQQTQTTALQLIDNPVLVDDAAFTPATSSVMMAGFEFDDTAPDSVNEGDAGAARMSARREVYVQVRDAAGNERGLNVDASGQVAVVAAAGTALIGRVSVSQEVGTLYQGTTSVTVGRSIIDAAGSGDNTLLAAQGASNKIRVHSLFVVSGGTVTVRFESGAGGTALTGQMDLVANTGFVLPFNPVGWFETAANTLLNMELSAAVSVDGAFQYSVVT